MSNPQNASMPTECERTFADYSVHFTPHNICVLLGLALLILLSTWMLVVRLSRGTIPAWANNSANILPLSFLGAQDQAKKVFVAGLTGAAIPLAIALPAAIDIYTCRLQVVLHPSDGIIQKFLVALTEMGVCVGLGCAVAGLLVVGLVPLRKETVQQMLVSKAVLTVQDVVHLAGSVLLFWGSYIAYASTTYAMYMTVYQDATSPQLLRLGLKLLPSVLRRVAYSVLGTFINDDDPDHRELLEQGRRQWSALILILAFVATLGPDVVMAGPSPSEVVNLDSNTNFLAFAWLVVATVLVLFLGAVVSACWSTHCGFAQSSPFVSEFHVPLDG